MTAAYYSILTNNGKASIANATISAPVGFSDIAVGDGNGSVPTPLETRTALVNEKARFACNSVALNPNNTNWIEAEIIIPTTSGGYTIRELGLYAGATLVAVANFPSTYKPLETEGGAREIAIKMVINVQNAEVISITLDNSLVYATRDWVTTYYVPRTDIVDNLSTNDATKPVSAKQAKALQDNKLDKNTKASTDIAGIVKLVNDLTTGGTDKALTAEQGKAILAMFGNSLTSNGYLKIPNPSDITKPIIMQWMSVSVAASSVDATFPIAFPNACLFAIGAGNTGTNTVYSGVGSFTTTKATILSNTSTSHIVYCLALGN